MGNQQYKINYQQLSQKDKIRLQQGLPVDVKPGVSITYNKKTGKLEGVPKEWVDGYQLPINFDQTKTKKYNKLPQQVRPAQTLPDNILELINSQPIIIGSPKNFKHLIHLEIDVNSPMGIKGLPNQWLQKLKMAGLNKEQIQQSPQVMIEIIQNYDNPGQFVNQLFTSNQFQSIIANIKFKQSDPSHDYMFYQQLGKGAMCKVVFYYQVYKCKHKKQESFYASRVMKITEKQILNRIKAQIAVMQIFKHPNIVQYIQSYYYMNCLFMLVQFMDGGSLTEIIYNYFGKIPQNVIAYIIKEILIGLLQIHKKHQIHRDLKSDNILIKKNGQIKIADFGFATQLTKDKMHRKSTVGTPAWMAPELILKKNYNQLVDIWSIGIIAFQLAQGQPPFLKLPPVKAMFVISTRQASRLNNKKYSNDFCEFIQKSLEKDVKKRYSAERLLETRFIRNVTQKDRIQYNKMVYNKKNCSLQELLKQHI